MYLDMAFLMHSRVCFVVIVRARVFAVLAISAIVLNHSCCSCVWVGGGGWYAYMFMFCEFVYYGML